MRNYRKIIWLVAPLMATFAVFISMKAQQQDDMNSQKEKALKKLIAGVPVADFNDQPPQDARRQKRSDRYNLSGAGGPVLNEDMEPVLLHLSLSHDPEEPAIPSSTSDAIVLGIITDRHAYLSSDKTNVYSEVTVSIEEVLKAEPRYPLNAGSTFEADRAGGAVRFPSGKILRRGFSYRHIPEQGHRYLLFLTYKQEGQNFTILTGYKISDNYVTPLDGVSAWKVEVKFRGYERYRGFEEFVFLQAVRAAIVNQNSLQ